MNPDACTLGFVYTQGNPNIKAEARVQTSGFKCGGSEGGLALTTDCSPLFKKMFGLHRLASLTAGPSPSPSF